MVSPHLAIAGARHGSQAARVEPRARPDRTGGVASREDARDGEREGDGGIGMSPRRSSTSLAARS